MSLTKVSYAMIQGDPVNVLDYGADPTGAVDSSTAIQNAINAGKSIYFPSGTYTCGSALSITTIKQLIGEGAGLTAATSSTVLNFSAGVSGLTIDSNNAAYTLVEGIFFNSNSTVAGSDFGIKISSPRVMLNNVAVDGFGSHGVWLTSAGGKNANLCRFVKVRSAYNFGDGFHLGDLGEIDTNVLHADQIEAVANQGWGIWSGRSNGSHFTKPLMDANTLGAFYDGSNGIEIINPYIESSETESTPITFSAFDVDTATDTFNISSHGFLNNDIVRFYGTGISLPAPITATTSYYIVNAATNSFQISTSLGGGTLDITTAGTANKLMYVKKRFSDDVLFDSTSSYAVVLSGSFGAEKVLKNGFNTTNTTLDLYRSDWRSNNLTANTSCVSFGTGGVTLYTFEELTEEKTISVMANVVAKEKGGANHAAYIIHGLAQNVAGTVTLQGQTAVSTIESNATWNATFTIISGTLRLMVSGASSVYVDWYASLQITITD